MMRKKVALFALFVCIATLCLVIFTKQPTEAITGADWSAGNIIDDAVFTDTSSMSVAQIQAFLNSKVPVCDTWGTGGSTSTARADYVRSIGYNVPLTCLRDFYEVPKTEPGNWTPANNYGGAPIPAGAKSAAEIIYNAAQQYHISPQVLLVKIGTESAGPLTSDDWPTPNQFTYAMGSHCPDSGPNGTANCDTDYAGFSIQMYSAAKLLRYYIDSMSEPWWPYRVPYQYNNISFAVNSSCGYSSVYIANRATAALYTYTPYQPDQAALNNLYGYGDSCSAYGNRNFWTTFSNWFGSTKAINGSVTLSKSLTISSPSNVTGETYTASYEISNSADYPISAGGFGICARINGENENYDFGFISQNTIPAKNKINISLSRTINKSGSLYIFICSYSDALGGWVSAKYPYNITGLQTSVTIQIKENPIITSGVTFSPTSPVIGQPVTANFTITNNSSKSIEIGRPILVTRDPNKANVDFPIDSIITILPNSTYTYSKTRIFSTVGDYSYFISNLSSNNTWNINYPKSSDNNIFRSGTLQVRDNPLITTSVTFSPASPTIDQTITANFTIANASTEPVTINRPIVVMRDPNGTNVDFSVDEIITIPANSTYTYSKTRAFIMPGAYKYYISNLSGENTWNIGYPKSSSNNIIRAGTLQIKDNPLITTGVSFSPTSPAAGQPVTASFAITNTSQNSVTIGRPILVARDPSGANVDFSIDVTTIIPANSTYTYSKTRTFSTPGPYKFFISNLSNENTWNIDYPKSNNSSIVRDGTLQVLDNPLITTGVSFSPATPAVGQPVTANFTATNASSEPVVINRPVIIVRDSNGTNFDFSVDEIITIPANSNYTYSKTRTFSAVGNYNYFISNLSGSNTWNVNYPKNSNSSIIRTGVLQVKDNPLITAGVSFNPANPLVNQPVTAMFNITNASSGPITINRPIIVMRDPNGTNVDFGVDEIITISANSTYTYSKSRIFITPGNYSYFISNLSGNSTWNVNYPKSANSTIIRYGIIQIK